MPELGPQGNRIIGVLSLNKFLENYLIPTLLPRVRISHKLSPIEAQRDAISLAIASSVRLDLDLWVLYWC